MSQYKRHLSIRVPWHDYSWEGCVCKNPEKNTYCTILKSIHEKKTTENCKAFSLETGYPPCVNEKVGFMSPNPTPLIKEYPYTYNKGVCGHFQDTKFVIPRYSASTIPFRWMLRQFFDIVTEENNLSWSLEDELISPLLSKKETWWQTKVNQAEIFKTFYNYITPKESLCFFYTKNAPFIEETKGRRIIIGIGSVLNIDDDTEYEYSEEIEGMHRALMWEHNVHHSIRSDNFEDGILMPYHELYQYSQGNHKTIINWEKCVVFSPEDSFDRFSYTTEHAYHEDGIDILLQTKKALKEISRHLSKDFSKAYIWTNNQINNLWKMRGIYPSFGEVLVAFGIKEGFDIEKDIANSSNGEDWWDYFEKNITQFSISSTLKIDVWRDLEPQKKEFYYNLSRMSLPLKIIKEFINVEDKESFLNNPYLFYLYKGINIFTVDKAFYPQSELTKLYPNIKGTILIDANDTNRTIGFITYILRKKSFEGHTLIPIRMILEELGDLNLTEPIHINLDDIEYILKQEHAGEFITKIELKHKEQAVQLKYYYDAKIFISKAINTRIDKANPIEGIEISSNILNSLEDDPDQKEALKKLSTNRFSILAGAAGTGKTEVIKAFCNIPDIKKEGILCLTPTGKARTILQKNSDIKVDTIAGFLIRKERYKDMIYEMKGSLYQSGVSEKTIIIDESSMLTEDMLGAILEVVHNAKRVILVGDDNQLPPIGAGKPFADIIKYLETHDKKEQHLVTLTKNHRQQKGDKSIGFALSFSAHSVDTDDYTIEESDNLVFHKWESIESLNNLLLEVLDKECDVKDYNSFLLSMGGTLNGNFVNFYDKTTPSSWQILSPARQNNDYGTNILNRTIHQFFHRENLNKIYIGKYRNRLQPTPTPLGEEKILFGSKLINTYNDTRKNINGNKEFVANGEVGFVKGRLDKTKDIKNDYLQVEFENLDGVFNFYKSDFSEEKETQIELAYALTVHKAQGSQFGKTIIIIPNQHNLFMSREMLYTALTRHQEKLIILHEGDREDLLKYQDIQYSNLARRMTNLLNNEPEFAYIDNEGYKDYFDMNRVHKTANGEFVRSKSEVIIANLLKENGVSYEYEPEFKIKRPDFIIKRDDIGITYIWEHLGMLEDKNYNNKWQEKKKWYIDNGVTSTEDKSNSLYQLITTCDKKGVIDSTEIDSIIKEYLI